MAGKLIRTHIAERIRSRGEAVPIRVLSESDFRSSLFDKMYEEADEIVSSDGKDANEFGDLLQVLVTLAEANGIEWAEVEKSRVRKNAELGDFSGRFHATFPGGRDVQTVRCLLAKGDYIKAFPSLYASLSGTDTRKLSLAISRTYGHVEGACDAALATIDAIVGTAWERRLKEYRKRDIDIHTRWLLTKARYVSLADFQAIPGIVDTARMSGAATGTIDHLEAACREILPLSVILCGEKGASR